MKVALCLYGLVGGMVGKDGKGGSLDGSIAFEHYKKHVLDKNDVDVFVHTWSVESKDSVLNLYKPKSYLIEPQRDFGIDRKKYMFRAHSRWYSTKESVRLKREYESNNGFTYDCVMLGRFDVAWFTDVIFDKFDMSYFWASNWNDAPHAADGWKGNRRNYSTKGTGLLDLWFFSNSKFIDKFATLYDNIGKYSQEYMTVASMQHARNCTSRINYTFYRWWDYELVRRKLLGGKE